MPATFPAHPAAVLPLKLWRPAWFDGVALVVGSMAPDLAYALDGSPLERPIPGLPPLWALAHSLPWFLAWALPVTIALCPLIRLSTPALATHLPALSPKPPHRPASARSFTHPLDSAFALPALLRDFVSRLLTALRGYASLGRGPRWYITASSAGIGALSHVLWDRIAVGPLDLVSSLLGGFFGLWLVLHFGRRLPSTPPSPLGPPATPHSASPVRPLGSEPGVLAQPSPLGPPAASHSASPVRPLGSEPGVPALPSAPDPPATPHSASLAHAVGDPGGLPSAAPGMSDAESTGAGGRRSAVYWGTVAAVIATGGAFLPLLPGCFLPHTTSARVILLAIAALLSAAATTATRSRPFRREPVQQ